MKFEKAYSKYLIYINDRQKGQSKRTLKERFKNHILPYFKGMDLTQIEQQDYIEFQNKLNEKNYSYNFKKNIHYLMVAFLDYCINKLKLDIKENVAKEVGNFKKKNEKSKSDHYTLKEFKRFIKNVDNIVYKLFFKFMFWVGTRPGETMALKFSDLIDKVIDINKTIDEHHNEDGIREIGTPKTESSIRKIKIDWLLNRQLLKLKKYYQKKYNDYEFDYYIFGGKKPLAPTTINRYKLKSCKKANIRPIRLHDFRHSNATLLISMKLMIKEVSRRLGHSDSSVTLNTYTHTNEEQEKRVLRTLNLLRLFNL